jgi:peptide/nickel transport system substrate-binding protein
METTMRRLLAVLLLALATWLPGTARAARDELVIGITQFPSTLNPNIDAMAAKSYCRRSRTGWR